MSTSRRGLRISARPPIIVFLVESQTYARRDEARIVAEALACERGRPVAVHVGNVHTTLITEIIEPVGQAVAR